MAANIQFVDYAAGRTLGPLATSTTSIQLAAGQGALFPAAGGGLYFYATLVDIETGGFNQHEVVKVTNKVGDLLTVVRGGIIDGIPQAWPAGSGVEVRDCAQALTDVANLSGGGGAPTGSPYVLVSPDASLPNRRILTGSGRVSVADGGPTGPITLDLVASGTDNSKLALMPVNTIKGNNTGAPANPLDLTAAQVATLIGAIAGVGVVSISAGPIGTRPAPGVAGRVWLATDDGSISRDTGASWFVLEPALTGDVTSVSGLSATTIAVHAVTNAKLAQMAGATFKANPLGSIGDAQDILGASAVNLLPVFGPSGTPSKGIVPAPGAVAGQRQFLREDATWAIPSSWWFNVKDYGAVGDGAADDTAAINAAFAAMPAGGGTLYFPYGTYKVTATLTTWNKAMTVLGDGWNSSTIATNSGTLDVAVLTGTVHVTGLRFQPSVSRTNGRELACTGGFQHVIDNCLFVGAFIGISILNAGGQVTIDTCSFRNFTASSGIGIDINTSGAGMMISNILMDAAAGAQPLAGIRVLQTQDLSLTNADFIHQGSDMLFAPTTGQVVASVYCTNTFFDTAITGLLVQPTGSGSVVRCNFANNWFSSHSSQGIRIIGGGATTVDGMDFVNTQCYFNGSHGVQVDAGAKNIRFIGGSFGQNIGDGLQFNTSDFCVMGCRVGTPGGAAANTGFGVNINNSTCDRFVVTGNDLLGNSLGALNNASTQNSYSIGNNLGDLPRVLFQGQFWQADLTTAYNAGTRTFFKTSVVNGISSLAVLPNGTSNTADFQVSNNSNPTLPSGVGIFRIGGAAVQILSTQSNAGTVLPIRIIGAGITQAEWNTSGDFQHKFGIADQGYSLQVPATGFAITVPDHCSSLMLNPAGVLATGTITMPANPVDGQLVRLATTQTVTALTLNANAGQTISGNVTTLSATAPASYMYVLSLTKWLKVGS